METLKGASEQLRYRIYRFVAFLFFLFIYFSYLKDERWNGPQEIAYNTALRIWVDCTFGWTFSFKVVKIDLIETGISLQNNHCLCLL